MRSAPAGNATSTGIRGASLTLILLSTALHLAGAPRSSWAVHDQGYICYICHSLNPSVARIGSNAIRVDQPILGSIPTRPIRTDRPMPATGGYPLSCDFCHKAATDVPATKFASKPRKHPVDLIMTGDNTANPSEITCNDCHAGRNGGGTPDNGDLVSQTLLVKGKGLGYGYPDHVNVTPGYVHTLSSNPPHLTQPYWSATDNSAFWTGVRNNTANMICWVCHDGTQQSPFTQIRASSNVRAEYTGTGSEKGHALRTTGGSLSPGSALPCYDCHDSHGSVNNGLVLDAPSIEGKSSLAVIGYNQGGRPYNDLVVCAGCHDTGRASTGTGTRVEGLDPVDPYNSTTTYTIHRPAIADVMVSSTRNCLSANAGCHAGPHAPSVSCSACHGDGVSSNWPDNTAGAYPDRRGAHAKHVDAIYNANSSALPGATVPEKKNNTCDWCHPGNPPAGHYTNSASGSNQAEVNRMDTTGDNVVDFWSAYPFRTITGATDNTGFYRTADRTCRNLVCHSGADTPGWYYTTDEEAPVWAAGSGIAATDLAAGGKVRVDWRRAVDAYPSNPVRYDLYRSTDNSPARLFAPDNLVLAGILDNTAVVSGLTDNTTYYFGVRARDSWVPSNGTTNSDVSVGVVPTSPAGPVSRTYSLQRSNGAALWGATLTSLSASCGTAVSLDVSGATSPPPPGRGLLGTNYVCPAPSTNNYMGSPTGLAGTERYFIGFYLPAYTVTTQVKGSATGNNFGIRPSWSAANTEWVRVSLAAVDNAGTHAFSPSNVVIVPTSSSMTPYQPDLSGLSVVVPPGQRLALVFVFRFYLSAYTTHQIAYDNFDASIRNTLTVTETPFDNVAPNWTGGSSGISVTNPGTGGTLTVAWNGAVDNNVLPNSPPVLYDLYRSEDLATVWFNLYRPNLGVTSVQDSELTDGRRYYYGVRAKDSNSPPNATTNTDNASGIPSRTGQYFGCDGCHGVPPTGTANGGSHAKHVDANRVSGGDSSGCNLCHPGASNYTSSHQDGKGQLGFAGAAFTAWYDNIPAGSLWYYDNVNLRYIYQDNTGYGVLTGARGDNTDTGTCLNTLCHGNPPNPPVWGSPSTVRCGYCHNPANSYGAIPTPPAVNDNGSLGPVSPHVSARKGSTFADRCRDCHSGHSGGVGVPLPPSGWNNNNGGAGLDMASILGFAGYSVSGRINLGGPGTDCTISGKTTEAEICWGCHDHAANAVTEWGYNTKTTPAGYPVSYASFPTQNDGTSERANAGYIYTDNAMTARTSDWTAGFWVNQYDNLIRRRVVSVHSANFDFSGQSSSVASNVNAGGLVNRTSPVLENRSYIRCSYCHDVHDLNRAQNDNSSGAPFLRGSWVGNPYPPELPPRASYPYTTRINTFGYPTPRALSTSRDRGGYFVDQNSGFPASNPAMDTLAKTAGLCILCHGANVDTLDFYKGATLWLPSMVNGHSNSTLGGTRANARDLFTGSRYGLGMGMQAGVPNTPWVCGPYGGECDSNYPQSWLVWGPCTGDCLNLRNSGWFGGPVDTMTQGGGDYANWYGTGTIGGSSAPGQAAHRFTCSKCHTPHAAGMPALLTHSCIDPAQGNFTIGGQTGTNLIANNCHRKATTTDGWHRLAPGQ